LRILLVLLIVGLVSLLALLLSPGTVQEESLVLYFSFDKEVKDEIKDSRFTRITVKSPATYFMPEAL